MTLLNTSPHLSPASEYKNCSSPVITPFFFFSHLLNIRLHANTAFAQYWVTRAQREENRMTFCTQQPGAFKTDSVVRPGKEGSSLRWGDPPALGEAAGRRVQEEILRLARAEGPERGHSILRELAGHCEHGPISAPSRHSHQRRGAKTPLAEEPGRIIREK